MQQPVEIVCVLSVPGQFPVQLAKFGEQCAGLLRFGVIIENVEQG